MGTVLTVCRVPQGQEADVVGDSGDRVLEQDLGDGTTLVLIVAKAHLDVLLQAELVTMARTADVAPALGDRSTWLPVQ